jgi:uncharacterized CHY-type Zn-finger protein
MTGLKDLNIFADFHHGDLYHSLHLLFEKRFGCNLYRPIGLEWFYEGYWKIGDPYPNPIDTAQQYLEYFPDDVKNPSNKEHFANRECKNMGEYYSCWQPSQEVNHKAITLTQFKKMEIDIVISSIPAHDVAFAQLIKKYKPNAKHIAQLGNYWGTSPVKNVMYSLHPSTVCFNTDQHVVYYTQEFDLELFKYITPSNVKKITNFVNIMPRPELYKQYKNILNEFEFKSYGISCPEGYVRSLKTIARYMQESMFGWNIKPNILPPGGGHIFNNWLAVGRPMITQLKGELGPYPSMDKVNLSACPLVHGENCIDLNEGTLQENVALIRKLSELSEHKRMCDNVYSTFKRCINFAVDAENVKVFLEGLK